MKNQCRAVPSESESSFFADISRVLQEGRSNAHAAINFAMVET